MQLDKITKKSIGRECYKLMKAILDMNLPKEAALTLSGTDFSHLGTDNMCDDELICHFEQLRQNYQEAIQLHRKALK
jgi:hypothetical protein